MQTDDEENLFRSLNESCSMDSMTREVEDILLYRLRNSSKCIQCMHVDMRALIRRVGLQHSFYVPLPASCSSCNIRLLENHRNVMVFQPDSVSYSTRRNLYTINWSSTPIIVDANAAADDADDSDEDVPDLVESI